MCFRKVTHQYLKILQTAKKQQKKWELIEKYMLNFLVL